MAEQPQHTLPEPGHSIDREESPPIAALFHVVFDQKVGYTTAWRRSITTSGKDELDLDGVEFHSLPSGLHAVEKDLVYFVHGTNGEEYAGISAYAQAEADAAQRNAKFCAVGALVPLSHGRLGKAWLHAPDLRKLADTLVSKHGGEDKRGLELYWNMFRLDQDQETGRESLAASSKRKRESEGLKVGPTIAADHPALYVSALLDSFGPLIFPLYRAAVLRDRILLLGTPPVQRSCNAVYILSVLSSIPHSLVESLPSSAEPLLKTRPLFSVGIPEISTLSDKNDGEAGWIATTTDGILGEKTKLYDLLVELAPGTQGTKRRRPRLRTSEGKIIKATQRDLRRYKLLRNGLNRMRLARNRQSNHSSDTPHSNTTDQGDEAPLLASQELSRQSPEEEEMLHGEDEPEVVEPLTWTAVAYNSFIWWASAGSADEQTGAAEEEMQLDRKLMQELTDIHETMAAAIYPRPSLASKADDTKEGRAVDDDKFYEAHEIATILTAFFHRLTTHTLQSLADIVAQADDETEGVEEDAIEVSAEDMRTMGLDSWSEQDRVFVKRAMNLYFGREAAVAEMAGWEVCGMKVC